GEDEPDRGGHDESDERGDGDGLSGLSWRDSEPVGHLGGYAVGQELRGDQQETQHHHREEPAVAHLLRNGGRGDGYGRGRCHVLRLAARPWLRPTSRPRHPTIRPAVASALGPQVSRTHIPP